jgi:hypothetical protein
MLSAYPHIDSSYSAVLASKDAPKSSQQPTEEHLRLIRTAMRQLEDARTGGKPAGYKKVHAALASKGPGPKVCAWVVAHDSQDRVKSDNAVSKKAHRESGSEQDQASRALDHATQMRKSRTAEGRKEAADKVAAKSCVVVRAFVPSSHSKSSPGAECRIAHFRAPQLPVLRSAIRGDTSGR